jgi:hypothetical protein
VNVSCVHCEPITTQESRISARDIGVFEDQQQRRESQTGEAEALAA